MADDGSWMMDPSSPFGLRRTCRGSGVEFFQLFSFSAFICFPRTSSTARPRWPSQNAGAPCAGGEIPATHIPNPEEDSRPGEAEHRPPHGGGRAARTPGLPPVGRPQGDDRTVQPSRSSGVAQFTEPPPPTGRKALTGQGKSGSIQAKQARKPMDDSDIAAG